MKAQPHVPLPHHKRASSRLRLEPVLGAGLVALLAAWGAVSFKGSAPAAGPGPSTPEPEVLPLPSSIPAAAVAAPAAETRAQSPALAAAVSVPSVLPVAFSAAAFQAVDRGAAFAAAWTKAAPNQAWVWPSHVAAFASAARKAVPASSRLTGWFPANRLGRQLQFAVADETGGEARFFEEELAAGPVSGLPYDAVRAAREHHQASMKSLVARAGVASVKDVSADGQMVGHFELTYQDGHKETITYDPLVFDLKGTGVKTNERKTLFDLYGYHKNDKIQWMNDIDDGTGILVFDSNGSGKSGKTGAEVFGDRTDLSGVGRPDGFVNGFAALHALVEKAVKQGVVSRDVLEQGVLESDALASLEQAYGLKIKLGGFNGKTVSLAEAGIKAISLSQKEVSRVVNFDGRRNDLLVQPGALFLRNDGSTGYYMNVWLAAKTGNLGLEGK